jgi:translation initiation factor eIF-2B subunit delta
MCFAMGNAIRLLKAKVNKFDIDTPEDEAKQVLLDTMRNWVDEKIVAAGRLISQKATKLISDGDVILVYGRHKLVQSSLLRAALEDKKKFEVLVFENPWDQRGQRLAKELTEAGIPVTYYPRLGGLSEVVRRASLVLVGGESFFANGAMYAASGTNEIVCCANDAGKGVVALCETINFDRERVATDGLTYNEIDPNGNSPQSFRFLFDVTREYLISGVLTEHQGETAVAPSEATLSILSQQEKIITQI